MSALRVWERIYLLYRSSGEWSGIQTLTSKTAWLFWLPSSSFISVIFHHCSSFWSREPWVRQAGPCLLWVTLWCWERFVFCQMVPFLQWRWMQVKNIDLSSIHLDGTILTQKIILLYLKNEQPTSCPQTLPH